MPNENGEAIVISDGPAPKKSNAIHGWTYQLKILILIFIRAVANGYKEFSINTENEKDFGKFDDAIFEYVKQGRTSIRLVQIKHVKDESKTIRYEDVGPCNHKKDSSKYRLIKYFESFLNIQKEVKNFILLTNLSLDVADDVLNDLFEEIQTTDDIFDVSLPDKKNIAKTSLPSDNKNTRNEDKIPKKYKLVYEQFKNIVEKDTKYQNMENSIKTFCEKFIFATGQPNDNEMNLVLENEIPRISQRSMSGLIYSEYMNTFLDWLNNKYENTKPLTHEDMAIIIPLIKLKTDNLSKNELYRKMLKDLKYELEDLTINKVTRYFENDDSNQKYLTISTKFPKLTLAKIFQCLEYKEKPYNGECLIIEVTNEIEENDIRLMQYFKFCVIILYELVDEDCMIRTYEKLKNNQRKVVILKSLENDSHSGDDCRFKHLQPNSKIKILDRKVSFDGINVSINKFGSIVLFESIQDTAWLSKLVDAERFIEKKILKSPEQTYIERYFNENSSETPRLIDRRFLFDDIFSKKSSFSEQTMANSNQKLIILSAVAGMGKTTLLSSINQKNKITNPLSWTEIIKLTDHVKVFPSYKTVEETEDVIEFISTKILKYDLFTAQLFKHQIEEMDNTVIMFDGFDEISQECKDSVLNIIGNLLKTKVKQIWVTSRPIAVESLEKRFSPPSFALTRFSEEDVIKCFSDCWSDNKIPYELTKLEKLIKDVLRFCTIDLCVPLYTKMAAEYFVTTDCNVDSNSFYNIIKLYENVIKKKYLHLLGYKSGRTNAGHISIPANDQLLIERYDEFHKILALQMLCPEFGSKHKLRRIEIDIINCIGIATVNIDDNEIIHFDHRTFAEYFLAKFVFDEFTHVKGIDSKTFDLLFSFKEKLEFREVLKFVDQFLDYSKPLHNKIKLTDPKHIKEMLNYWVDEKWDNTAFIYICLDNIDVMEHKLNQISLLKFIHSTTHSYRLVEKYFIELKKQLTNEQLKEFIVLDIIGYYPISFEFLEIFFNLLEKHFPNIYKIISECGGLDVHSNGRHETNEIAFTEFCNRIIKSGSVDIFMFSIYAFAQSMIQRFSEEYINTTLNNLIEASKNSKFDFDEKGHYLHAINFKKCDHAFLFYKNLIKAFQNQKKAFMNYLKIPETVLTFDEFEIMLTGNVEVLTENLKNIIKSFGTFFLSYKYVQLTENWLSLEIETLKPYFERLIKYENEELVAICDLIGLRMDNFYLLDRIFNIEIRDRSALFVYTINQPKSVIDCLFNQRFIINICYIKFIKMIQDYKYCSKRLSLVIGEVLDDNSEIHLYLLKRRLEELLKIALKLDSLELLKKIATTLDKEINKNGISARGISHSSGEICIGGIDFETLLEKSEENCKEFFIDFVKKLNEKLAERQIKS